MKLTGIMIEMGIGEHIVRGSEPEYTNHNLQEPNLQQKMSKLDKQFLAFNFQNYLQSM